MVRLMNQFMVTFLVKIGPSNFYAIKRGSIQQITRILHPVISKKVCQNTSLRSESDHLIERIIRLNKNCLMHCFVVSDSENRVFITRVHKPLKD